MWSATLDGVARCRACGRIARLDVVSRWMVSCVLALMLPIVLLYGDVFYSGHLFVVSIFLILAGWRVLSSVGFPFLTLEPVASNFAMDRRQSLRTVAVLVVAAIVLDGFMASRFDSDEAQPNERSASVVRSR